MAVKHEAHDIAGYRAALQARRWKQAAQAGAAALFAACLPACGIIGANGSNEASTRADGTPNPSIASNDALNLPAQSADEMIPGVAPSGVSASSSDSRPVQDFSSLVMAQNGAATMKGWERSASESIRAARLQNKLLLTVATASGVELSQQMYSTLLSSQDFHDVTDNEFIRLYVDYDDRNTAKSEYYTALKKRLKVHGFPSLIITLPNGVEVIRFDGYDPEWNGRYLKSIRDAKDRALKMMASRRKGMEAAGFRTWKDKQGKAIFARLENADANQLTFTAEWGDAFRTFLNRLDPADQEWIRKQPGMMVE